MWLTVIFLLSSLAAFSIIMFTVHRVRPESFRLRAAVTKWISIDLEMRMPKRLSKTKKRRQLHGDDNKTK
jgi:hypothetical protein